MVADRSGVSGADVQDRSSEAPGSRVGSGTPEATGSVDGIHASGAAVAEGSASVAASVAGGSASVAGSALEGSAFVAASVLEDSASVAGSVAGEAPAVAGAAGGPSSGGIGDVRTASVGARGTGVSFRTRGPGSGGFGFPWEASAELSDAPVLVGSPKSKPSWGSLIEWPVVRRCRRWIPHVLDSSGPHRQAWADFRRLPR